MNMEHYNLYYIFLEDWEQNPMPEAHSEKVLKKILEIFQKNKTVWNPTPPKKAEEQKTEAFFK